jgi:hypothetical protein
MNFTQGGMRSGTGSTSICQFFNKHAAFAAPRTDGPRDAKTQFSGSSATGSKNQTRSLYE